MSHLRVERRSVRTMDLAIHQLKMALRNNSPTNRQSQGAFP